MVFLFNRTTKNILSNHIPQEIIFKELINEKNYTFRCYCHCNDDLKLFNKVEYPQNELKSLIEANKESIIYVSRKE